MEVGHTYLYKDRLPIGFLGLVDDIIGVTEAGIEAQKLNAFVNLKTAEKSLQFGTTKNKSMLVGKDVTNVVNANLKVDIKWIIKYKENTGEADLEEFYCGLTDIEETDEQKYLGFILSNTGNNMANIREMKKKSNGVIRSTLNKLNSLNLKQYYFECALVLMNAMVRSSLLYAADMYYDLKESELRQIERIEENYLRQVLKTSKGCPIIQMYLAVGQIPARFEIQKMRLLYLKYILHQDSDSLLSKFFYLQLDLPTKGDWASTCIKDLKELNIEKSMEDIKEMTENQYRKLLKQKVAESAFSYLTNKKGSKGSENRHIELGMEDYLLPTNCELSVSEKQKMFSVKNRMTRIPANFPKANIEYKCYCGSKEDMKHIYECEILNGGNQPSLEYEKLYKGTISEQIKVFRKFEINLAKREQLLNEIPHDHSLIHCIPESIVMG